MVTAIESVEREKRDQVQFAQKKKIIFVDFATHCEII